MKYELLRCVVSLNLDILNPGSGMAVSYILDGMIKIQTKVFKVKGQT